MEDGEGEFGVGTVVGGGGYWRGGGTECWCDVKEPRDQQERAGREAGGSWQEEQCKRGDGGSK